MARYSRCDDKERLMKRNNELTENEVRLLNALGDDFNKLYELSGSVCRMIEKGAVRLEHVLHRGLTPEENQLSELAYQLQLILYRFKSRQYEGGNDIKVQSALVMEYFEIEKYLARQKESFDNQRVVVEEEGDFDDDGIIYYHGTDARMVIMSEVERRQYKQACMTAIDYLWPFFEPYYQRDVMVKELKEPLGYYDDRALYANLHDALTRKHARMTGNQLYQYDCFYVTNLRGRAKSYAFRAFAGGEIGLTAYRMYQAALKIGFPQWAPSAEVEAALKQISDFAHQPAQPVLFAFDRLELDYLQDEDGSAIDDFSFLPQNARYNKAVVLDIAKAIPVETRLRKEMTNAQWGQKHGVSDTL